METNDGSVQVFTGASKQVEFVVYQGYEINKTIHIDSRQDGDSVQITARVSGHWEFYLEQGTPDEDRSAHAQRRRPQRGYWRRSVDTNLVSGRVKIHTGDGPVRVQSVSGDVEVDTGDGSITLEGAKGEIHLHTGDGRVEARDLDGRVNASSGDGHITIAGRLDALDIKTGDGSINAQLQPGSKVTSSWSIRTGDGSVDVVLPPICRRTSTPAPTTATSAWVSL